MGKLFAYLRAACAVSALLAIVALAPASASAKEECWQELVEDWSDGAISNLYPIRCYRQALQNMPEDVRLYSSAGDDINRALSGRVVSRSLAGSSSKAASRQPVAAATTADGSSSVPFVLGGSLAALLAFGGAAAFYAHRKWRGAARLRAPNDQ